MKNENSRKMTDFDCMVSPEPLQIMKALIPFAPPQGQRFLSIYTKAMEMRNTLQALSDSQPDVSICSAPQEGDDRTPVAILKVIRDYCSPETCQTIDEYMNLASMFQMMEVMQNMPMPKMDSLSEEMEESKAASTDNPIIQQGGIYGTE